MYTLYVHTLWRPSKQKHVVSLTTHARKKSISNIGYVCEFKAEFRMVLARESGPRVDCLMDKPMDDNIVTRPL
jgi:hypothetical protein